MAKISCTNRFIAIASKGNFKIFSTETGDCMFTYVHKYEKAMDGNNKPLDERLEDICAAQNGNYFCSIYSDKRLIIVSTKSWTIVKEIKAKRRPTAMTFDNDGKILLVADKSGDLYQCNVEPKIAKDEKDSDAESEDQPILGHVSMVLDVKMSHNGKYILTADRDEKIRVSEFENPYVIESFCLGHTEFVCNILPVPWEDGSFFLSSSGDGTVRLWDATSGGQLGELKFAGSANDNNVGSGTNGFVEERIFPALMACDTSGSFVAVASDQDGQKQVFVTRIGKDEPSFTPCSKFLVPECQRIADLAFGPGGCILYMLVVPKKQKLTLLTYHCSDGVCHPMPSNASIMNTINQSLQDFDCCGMEWESLFKIRCEGEVYSSYQRKKEERLAAKSKRLNSNDPVAKRAKLRN